MAAKSPKNAPPAWQNRIIGTGEESPEQLLANPRNFRMHPAAQQEAMSATLDTIGWIQDIIVNRRTGYVIDGHLRVSLAMRTGQLSVPVKYVDLSPEEEALALATYDPISAMAVTDAVILGELLQELPATTSGALQSVIANLAEQSGIVPRAWQDPSAEWVGMPDFNQDDLMPVKQLIVSFRSAEDVQAFADLLEQHVDMRTKSIWYPIAERLSNAGIAWEPGDDLEATAPDE